MEFDLENPFTSHHDLHFHTPTSLFLLESDHMPSQTYYQSLQAPRFVELRMIRRESISFISQFCSNYDPLLCYLAINYLDRFLSSSQELLMQQPKPWVLRLLAIACISLASKMQESHFSLIDIQSDGGIVDTRAIERMENLILGELKWRMRSITPFSFISFLISNYFKLDDEKPMRQALKARSTEFIFKSPNEIKLLKFKPSEIAASALLVASHQISPLQFPFFSQEVSNSHHVNKENVFECFNIIQESFTNGYESVIDTDRRSDTPVNVLDHKFSSSESESPQLGQERGAKRRKMEQYFIKNHTSRYIRSNGAH